MKQPLVSIIIPTYNRIHSLAELMESLIKQTFTNFEVIIVNDAGNRVDELKELYWEINCKIINLEQNSKHVKARNVGVSHAIGEYIMLIDDDDIILPTHIERMVEELNHYDLVYSDVEIVDYNHVNNQRIPKSRLLFAYNYDLKEMKKFSTFVPSGSLYRKQLHDHIGYFDEAVMNYWDWDFFLRVASSYKVKRVPIAGVLYEFSSEGDNQSKNLTSMRKYLDRLSEKHELGPLPTKNFFLLLKEPEVIARQAESEVIWDGQPIRSRLIL
ncbi:glycosyltransferase family 2 protein [Aquibacillus kalidii]|uniref:glycosyltransferase family 2 protein n=1 Tax=Aquibacillus kalidii TaxID=2762597 RepID=UPI001645C34E|nr:glycosyltransferase family 2 protein [Aquibacillus kalidii]